MAFYKKDIERILNTIKVEDSVIMAGDPIVIEKYGKKFTIRQINWFYEWDKFVYNLGMFMSCYSTIVKSMALPDGLEDLLAFRKNIRLTVSNNVHGKMAFHYLCKILGIFGFGKFWMKRHFSIDDYVEVFLIVYLFNIMGVKKNLKVAFDLIGKVRSN